MLFTIISSLNEIPNAEPRAIEIGIMSYRVTIPPGNLHSLNNLFSDLSTLNILKIINNHFQYRV